MARPRAGQGRDGRDVGPEEVRPGTLRRNPVGRARDAVPLAREVADDSDAVDTTVGVQDGRLRGLLGVGLLSPEDVEGIKKVGPTPVGQEGLF